MAADPEARIKEVLRLVDEYAGTYRFGTRPAIDAERAALESFLRAPVEAHDELSVDDDGDVAMDWATKDGDMLSMSLASNGRLAIAASFGDKRGHGNVWLHDIAYKVLRKILDEAPPEAAPGGDHD